MLPVFSARLIAISEGKDATCGAVGSGPYEKKVKGKMYKYFAHRYKGFDGKWKIKWHRVG